jgi:hypothetical protein
MGLALQLGASVRNSSHSTHSRHFREFVPCQYLFAVESQDGTLIFLMHADFQDQNDKFLPLLISLNPVVSG